MGQLRGTEATDGVATGELISRMENAGLWSSPGGKTPAATLYAALLREITVKQAKSRFRRVGKGRFLLQVPNAQTPASPRDGDARGRLNRGVPQTDGTTKQPAADKKSGSARKAGVA